MNTGDNFIGSEPLNAGAGDFRIDSDTRLTLRKGEKLRHRSLVDPLFREGESIYEFPLRLTWRRIDLSSLQDSFCDHVPERIDHVQMLITVPKKKRKHAVDRVLMRRRIREAYRINRQELKDAAKGIPNHGTLSMAFIYLHDKNMPYANIERKMHSLLNKLKIRILKDSASKLPV